MKKSKDRGTKVNVTRAETGERMRSVGKVLKYMHKEIIKESYPFPLIYILCALLYLTNVKTPKYNFSVLLNISLAM